MTVKISDLDATWIRLFASETQASVKLLAQEYGVHRDTIRNIIRGNSHTGEHRAGRRDRKIPAKEIREMRRLAATGLREHAIKNATKSPRSRSTIRQVIDGESYKDVK